MDGGYAANSEALLAASCERPTLVWSREIFLVEHHSNAPARVTQKHRAAVVSELFEEERQKDLVELRIRLPREIKDRLESLRRDTGIPMDSMARKAIVEFLEKIDQMAQKLAIKNLK